MTQNGEWNESLYGCFDDFNSCLCGFCCTPCQFGDNVKKTDGSSCVLWCCAYMCLMDCYLCWVPHYFKRTELRQKYGLREDPSCGDLLTTLCCSPCAICQEARFLKRRAGQQNIVVRNAAPQMVQQDIVIRGVAPQTAQPSTYF